MLHAVVFLIGLAVAFGAGQPPAAQFEITPETVLADERFSVGLTGVKPGQEVTIRVEGNRGVWHSSGSFRADARGRVEVGDPMRLVWSATGDRPQPGTPGAAVQPWTFTAEVDGRITPTKTPAIR